MSINQVSQFDELVNEVYVLPPGMWENQLNATILNDWWAVCHEDIGIFAYFAAEHDAERFRLDYIAGRLYPMKDKPRQEKSHLSDSPLGKIIIWRNNIEKETGKRPSFQEYFSCHNICMRCNNQPYKRNSCPKCNGTGKYTD